MHVSLLNGILLAIVVMGWGTVGFYCLRASRRAARFEARWAAMAQGLRDLDAELDRVWVDGAARDWRHR